MRVKVGGEKRWMKRKAKGGEGEKKKKKSEERKERLFGRESLFSLILSRTGHQVYTK